MKFQIVKIARFRYAKIERRRRMGKRKNRHCQSKQEVLQRVWEKKRGQQEHLAKRQLRTINQVRPAIERAGKQMQEKNRRESRNDVE